MAFLCYSNCVSFLLLLALLTTIVEANRIKCLKQDECSCMTDTNPQLYISLWKIQRSLKIYEDSIGDWFYAVDLCHGVKLTIPNKMEDKGCQNSTTILFVGGWNVAVTRFNVTANFSLKSLNDISHVQVCRYMEDKLRQPKKVYEVGHYGSARFGDYDNSTKSIKIFYTALMKNNITRSIVVDLVCGNQTNSFKVVYEHFAPKYLEPTHFSGNITGKAGCLIAPLNSSPSTMFSTSGLTRSSTLFTTDSNQLLPTSYSTSKVESLTTNMQFTLQTTIFGTQTTPVIMPSKRDQSFTTLSTSQLPILPNHQSGTLSLKSSIWVQPTSKPDMTPACSNRLAVGYIVLISVLGTLLVIGLCSLAGYSVIKKRRSNYFRVAEEETSQV